MELMEMILYAGLGYVKYKVRTKIFDFWISQKQGSKKICETLVVENYQKNLKFDFRNMTCKNIWIPFFV